MLRPAVFSALLLLACLPYARPAVAQDDLTIWREFVGLLRSGSVSSGHVRPYEVLGDAFKPVLLSYLDSLRARATADDWDAVPEVIRTEDRIQYIVPWTDAGRKVPFSFSFVVDGSRWYFQHLEAIMIRLDRVTEFPATEFPDIAEEQKHWIREETYWSFVVFNVYLPAARERGKQTALEKLRDGAGYFLAAQSWVPFTSSRRAFVLYLCWEQKNLRGNDVTLARLDDDEAVVVMNAQYFALYAVAAHLKPAISFEDYREIFEFIWQDRAASAGWNLRVNYGPDNIVTFRLTDPAKQQ